MTAAGDLPGQPAAAEEAVEHQAEDCADDEDDEEGGGGVEAHGRIPAGSRSSCNRSNEIRSLANRGDNARRELWFPVTGGGFSPSVSALRFKPMTPERLRMVFFRISARLTLARYFICRSARRSRHLGHWHRDLPMNAAK